MVTEPRLRPAATQGHVGVYAGDARRRHALARSLDAAGHSHREASTPAELHRLLDAQRFDVATLIVRNPQEAAEIAAALDSVRLPMHTILLGSADALPLSTKRRRGGTVRYVPGHPPAGDVARLVDTSISAGAWDESHDGDTSNVEHIELEEIIESAAATVYRDAKRKRQRFQITVLGPDGHVIGRRVKLRRMFGRLLGLVISLAPAGASITIKARAASDEWLIAIGATPPQGVRRRAADSAEELGEDTAALKAASQDVRDQGGVLWVELAGPAAPALHLTLPLPAETDS